LVYLFIQAKIAGDFDVDSWVFRSNLLDFIGYIISDMPSGLQQDAAKKIFAVIWLTGCRKCFQHKYNMKIYQLYRRQSLTMKCTPSLGFFSCA